MAFYGKCVGRRRKQQKIDNDINKAEASGSLWYTTHAQKYPAVKTVFGPAFILVTQLTFGLKILLYLLSSYYLTMFPTKYDYNTGKCLGVNVVAAYKTFLYKSCVIYRSDWAYETHYNNTHQTHVSGGG